MAWYITNGILERADTPPAENSILTDITGEGNVIIPEGVTAVGDNAFFRCYHLTGITFPDSVTSVGNQAFYACENLTGISIPNSVTSIRNNAFHRCSNLTSINISENHPAFYPLLPWLDSLFSFHPLITVPD